MSAEYKSKNDSVESILQKWSDLRFKGIIRDYKPEDVLKLRPKLQVQYTLASFGAQKLWRLLNTENYVTALGALTGAMAVQMAKAGMKSLYLSGWQVAADANQAMQTYPDQSLYPSNSAPQLVKRLNNALMRADQISKIQNQNEDIDYYLPIVADAEAGFGGVLHAFELMKSMIEAGAAGVHFEDQLASEKKCGHLGGKVLVPTANFIRMLTAARLAADVLDVPTVLVARTDALSATYLTSDVDPRDQKYITGKRTSEGYYSIRCGMELTIDRALSYAPYADLLWFETSKPDLGEAREFAQAIHEKHPGKLLAYNCSPSFNWSKNLDAKTIAKFNELLGEMGYKYQFITLAGWHLINYYSFDLAKNFSQIGMPAYVELQNAEFAKEKEGYTATKHQAEVGTGYFDEVLMTITKGEASTAALKGSTEAEQFYL
jgi:isocitrate lyase